MSSGDRETGEGFLDNETGERRQTVTSIRTNITVTNVETGEPENTSERDCKGDRRRIFQIPKEVLKKPLTIEKDEKRLRCQPVKYEEITLSHIQVRTNCLEKNMVRGTQNVSPIVFMIPTLFLFPAWASILCVICEACVHIWAHKRNSLQKDRKIKYKSPLHLISSEFCAHCQSDKRMQRISKLQDERTMRRKVVHTDYIRRVVT